MKNIKPIKTARFAAKKISLFIFSLTLVLGLSFAAYAANDTDLNLTVTAGVLNIDIVDASGNSVANPAVALSAITASTSAQSSTGTLGTASEKIRLSNPTVTPSWTATIAATNGASAVWTTTGGSTMDYNSAIGGTGTLAINPSVGTIVAAIGGNTTGVTVGTATAFGAGTGSITLYSANGTAAVNEQYDLTGVRLDQQIPGSQLTGAYTINMTLTAI